MYLAWEKRGSKWVGLATWEGGPQSCIAVAEDAFQMAGIPVSRNAGAGVQVTYTDRAESQKNFAGYVAKPQVVTYTLAEVKSYSDQKHAAFRAAMEARRIAWEAQEREV